MQGPLAQWIKRRRQLQEAALAEYERAQAHTPPALLYASEEVGKLQADFAEHFVTASISAMPPSIRDSAPMSVAFENAIREAAEPQLAAARAAFTRCASEARTAKLELLKARCDKRLAALPRVHADVSPELSPNLADAKARPWLKTRQPRACVYAGSLETYAPVFASIDDAQPVAHLAGAFAVEVDELTPATSDGGRTRIDLSWPVRATWWLDASAKPLELARRVDIVPGHVWLEPGSPVTVTQRAGTRVTVVRDLTERGRRKVEPQSFQATLNCSELRLASYAKALWAHEGERMLLPTEGARLFDAPGGKPVPSSTERQPPPRLARGKRAGSFAVKPWQSRQELAGRRSSRPPSVAGVCPRCLSRCRSCAPARSNKSIRGSAPSLSNGHCTAAG